MKRIAFCGLGLMGSGMARSLLRAGHQVCVWNRAPEKTTALHDAGASIAATPHEAAVDADVAFSMVSDDEASRAVWLGADGMLDALSPGALVLECSTLSHAWVMELAERATERSLHYLDCPVTGLPEAASNGELTLLMGGGGVDLERARPCLEALSKEIVVFGGVGAGTAYKLIVNLLGAVEIAATAEAMETAGRAGLDLEQVATALEKGAAGSFHVGRQAHIMAAESHEENLAFTTDLRRKDTRYGVELSRELGVSCPMGDRSLSQFDRASLLGYGDKNESHVLDAVRNESTSSDEAS